MRQKFTYVIFAKSNFNISISLTSFMFILNLVRIAGFFAVYK